MTIYSEKSGINILDSASDADGDPLSISRVNGDPALVGQPVALVIGGSVRIAADGVATFDDAAFAAPADGVTVSETITVSVSDGLAETQITVTLEITGITPAMANAASFGALTLAGAGGVAVNGTVITSTSAGNVGDWQIAGGRLSPSGAGPISSATLTFDSGDTLSVTVEPDTWDVASEAELDAAIAAAQGAAPGVDYHIGCRDFVLGAYGSTNIKTLSGLQFSGTLADGHKGKLVDEVWSVRGDVAAITGGSLRLFSRLKYGAEWRSRLRLVDCFGVIFDGVWFSAKNTDFTYRYRDDSDPGNVIPGNSGENIRVIDVSMNAASARGAVIFQNCRIGAADSAATPENYILGIQSMACEDLIVQDCVFDGLYKGFASANAGRDNIRRCEFKNIVEDFFNKLAIKDNIGAFGAATYARIEAYDNVAHSLVANPEFAGAHVDFFQWQTASDVKGIDLRVAFNVFVGDNDTTPHPSYPNGSRATQGIYSDNKSNYDSAGEIAYNFLVCTAFHGFVIAKNNGIQAWSNTVLTGSLFARNVQGGSGTGAWYGQSNAGSGNAAFIDMLATRKQYNTGEIVINSFSNVSWFYGGPNSYDAIFDGPFSSGAFGAAYAVDFTDMNTVAGSIDAIFRPGAASGHSDKGHLKGVSARPAYVAS